jgi:hypothetical protein
MLSQGATSATEAWNADPSDSLDHFMWGHIIEWFYHDLAGVQSDPSAPGFENVIIKPAFVGSLAWVNAGYDSILGPIASSWMVTNNLATLTIVIPPGATGRIYLPTLGTATNNLLIQESGVTIMQNGLVAGNAIGVAFDRFEGAATQTFAVWDTDSGSYTFVYGMFPAPAGLAATVRNGQVSLSWNAVSDVTGYNVKRGPVSGGPYTIVGGNVTGTNFTDSTVTNGSTYYYVVSAVRTNGESFNSLEAGVTVSLPEFVPNFGFETPAVGSYQYNPSGASWTFTAQSGANGSGIAANGSAFTSLNPNAPQGVQVAFLQGAASVSQTIPGFISGVNYMMTFAAAQRNYQQNGGQTWNVTVDGTVVGSFAPPRVATNYADYTANFTATAASHTLAFAGTDAHGGDNTVFLDNVRITPVVPAAPTGTNPPALGWQVSSGQIQLSWPADHTGWTLETQTNLPNPGLTTNWIAVPGSILTNQISLPLHPTGGSVFFRLILP